MRPIPRWVLWVAGPNHVYPRTESNCGQKTRMIYSWWGPFKVRRKTNLFTVRACACACIRVFVSIKFTSDWDRALSSKI